MIASFNYDSERDVENPTGSIFCAGGTGFYVPWDEVKRYMHVEPVLPPEKPVAPPRAAVRAARDIADDEDLRYWDTTANRGRKVKWKRRTGVKQQEQTSLVSLPEPREEYLLVDGYNVIHAWPELQDLAQGNMDAARMRLLDALSSYQGIKKNRIIVVFDAYRVQNRAMEESHDYHNIHVVFTKEAQTADEYIEKFAHDHKKKYDIVVATSDALQQVIIRSAGCALLSARELREEIEAAKEQVMRTYLRLQRIRRSSLQDSLATDIKKRLEDLRRDR